MAPFDDLQGTLHAAFLLFLPVATIGLVLAYQERPTAERVMRGIVVGLLVIGAFVLLGMYYGRDPWPSWPVAQVVIVVGCIVGSVWIGHPTLQQGFCLFLLIAGCALFLWYALLVQTRYAGRSDWLGEQQKVLDRHLASVRSEFAKFQQPDQYPYLPGWLSQSEIAKVYQREVRGLWTQGSVERAAPLWHSWLTSLNARVLVVREIYYPGGRLSEGAPKMEWRDRTP